MQVKEITVAARKSRNYQTYEVSKTFIIEDGDDVDILTKEAQTWCRKRCHEQLEADMK